MMRRRERPLDRVETGHRLSYPVSHAGHICINCQGAQRWRERFLGKEWLQINEAVDF